MRDNEKEELCINLLYLKTRREELGLSLTEEEEREYIEAVECLKSRNIEIPFGINY